MAQYQVTLTGCRAALDNLELAQVYDEIDSLLAATLKVDDHVDLNTLRIDVQHPPFDRPDLESPIPPADPIADPEEPVFEQPPPPKGLLSFLGKKKHEREVADAIAAHERAITNWKSKLAQTESRRKEAAAQHAEKEAQRLSALERERERYVGECAEREKEAAERNEEVDALIANLGYGSVDAVQEYVSIVLSNSVYPEHFEIEHRFEFDAATAELTLRVVVPGPENLPAIRAYKYKKASDEIVSTALSQKACKDRYASVVHQVALRSLHEVFEADRRGLIRTIALEVGAETNDPATGKVGFISFVAVGAEREAFLALDLSNVVPAATLDHLGAAVSKNPLALVAANVVGIRRS